MKDIKKAMRAYIEAKKAMEEAKATMAAYQAIIEAEMETQGTDSISAGKYRASRGTIEQRRFDSKAFRADYSAIYEQYKHPVTLHRFNVSA